MCIRDRAGTAQAKEHDNNCDDSKRFGLNHYKFYEQWLDAGMTYSSALFSSVDQTLEEAQDAKLDRVIDMLGLAGGETVLEIGCGRGGLAERLMDRHDCAVTGSLFRPSN